MQFLLQLQGHNVTKLLSWGFPFSRSQFLSLIPDALSATQPFLVSSRNVPTHVTTPKTAV